MAVKLAAEQGYQPVIMLDSPPNVKGSVASEQHLATLLYYADQINQLKEEGKIMPDAPPVFVLDTHRLDAPIAEIGDKVDNTSKYTEKDFPSAETLSDLGVNKVIFLNEADLHGTIIDSRQPEVFGEEDLQPIIKNWQEEGIKILTTGIAPWGSSASLEMGAGSDVASEVFPVPIVQNPVKDDRSDLSDGKPSTLDEADQWERKNETFPIDPMAYPLSNTTTDNREENFLPPIPLPVESVAEQEKYGSSTSPELNSFLKQHFSNYPENNGSKEKPLELNEEGVKTMFDENPEENIIYIKNPENGNEILQELAGKNYNIKMPSEEKTAESLKNSGVIDEKEQKEITGDKNKDIYAPDNTKTYNTEEGKESATDSDNEPEKINPEKSLVET